MDVIFGRRRAAAFTFAHDKIVKIERISARDRLRRVEAEGTAGR
ncbi:hypothetical protein [Nonomuraea sp. NPDC048916]